MPSLIAIAEIIVDHSVNARQGARNAEAIAEYAQALEAGATFPAVDVFRDPATGDLYLGEGFHRIGAYEAAERTEIPANIYDGTRRDAILHASGANSTHGLRRTRDDKRRAVSRLLFDEEWKTWSDRQIAVACNVSHTFVAKIRQEIDPAPPQSAPPADEPPQPRFEPPAESGNVATLADEDQPNPPPPAESGNVATLTVEERPKPPPLAESGNVATLADEDQPKPPPPAESGNVATLADDEATCPDGTAHDFDGDACTKCHTPDPSAPELPPELPRQNCPLCLGAGSVDLNLDPIAQNLRDSPKFLESWAEWRLYRRKARKPMPPTTVSRQLNKLEKFGPSKAIKSINASLENGWTGLFDPDEPRNGKPANDINRGKGELPDPNDKF